MEGKKEKGRTEIYSKRVRAGKRTYFLDVKSTRSNDFYLTITESKRRYRGDENFYYEKHKIFLYKEDFNKFMEALEETVAHVKANLLPDVDFSKFDNDTDTVDNTTDELDEVDDIDEIDEVDEVDSELKWD